MLKKSVLEDCMENGVTHANLLEEISLISNAVGNKLLEAMAKDKTCRKLLTVSLKEGLGITYRFRSELSVIDSIAYRCKN